MSKLAERIAKLKTPAPDAEHGDQPLTLTPEMEAPAGDALQRAVSERMREAGADAPPPEARAAAAFRDRPLAETLGELPAFEATTAAPPAVRPGPVLPPADYRRSVHLGRPHGILNITEVARLPFALDDPGYDAATARDIAWELWRTSALIVLLEDRAGADGDDLATRQCLAAEWAIFDRLLPIQRRLAGRGTAAPAQEVAA